MSPGEPIVQPGAVVAGKYRIERVLGRGGMGLVVAARHLHLDQMVALKFMLPMGGATALERFFREARTAFRLSSEHVARVLDVGVSETGSPYIVMEYLTGTNLADLLAQQGPMPVPVAVDLVLQACEAIAEAHALGIVHRDLKPANLFLTQRPDGSPLVKVLDFGISKLSAELAGGEAALTKTNRTIGSPHHMSPEQIMSAKTVDRRADIWSLGVILFELATGTLPFQSRSVADLCLKIVREPAPRLTGPGIPNSFADLVARCLEKDLKLRYPDVGELAEALAFFSDTGARTSRKRIVGVVQMEKTPPPQPGRGAPLVGLTSPKPPTKPPPPPRPASPSQPIAMVGKATPNDAGLDATLPETDPNRSR